MTKGDPYRWYWKRLATVTLVWLVIWLFIAVLIEIPNPYVFRGIRIGSLPPLHWYVPAFIVIVVGILAIFAYAAYMDRVDREFLKLVKEGEK